MQKINSVRTIIVLAGSLLLQLNTLCFHSRGAVGDVDLSFDPGSGVNGPVNAVVLRPDGKVIIGGLFTTVNGLLRTNVARLNVNGSGDATFNPGPAAKGPVSSVALHSAGKVLFTATYPGYTDPYFYEDYQVGRLNSDGMWDGSFVSWVNPIADGYGGEYRSIVVQPDGKLLLGGYFFVPIEYPGLVAQPRIIRLNTNGSVDSSFDSRFAFIVSQVPEYSGSVSSVAVQPDGKVLIVGDFLAVNGANGCYGIARLNPDGYPDGSFNAGTGVSGGIVTSVAVQPDGKVLIGGTFSTVNGTNRFGIARLHANGSLDLSFNPGSGAYGVSSIVLQPDGKVLIGGAFITVNGTNRNRIARLNANGSLDPSFDPGTGAGGYVRSIALQPDGNILIGGDFTTVNGVVRPYVARLYGDSVALSPSLTIARSDGAVTVFWPLSASGFVLDQGLSATGTWSQVTFPYETNAAGISISLPTPAGNRFYRLRKL
jgi:uncharacterized delta-60 repeat protein